MIEKSEIRSQRAGRCFAPLLLPTSDLRPPTSDLRPPTSDLRPPPPPSALRPPPSALRPPNTIETIKSIIAWAISPVILALLIQIVGWILWRLKRRRLALVLVALGSVLLLVGSLPIISFHTNRSREAEYPPLNPSSTLDPARPVLVVVLGTGFNPDPELPPNSRVSGTFLTRLVEGVRIHRNHHGTRLLVSVANPDATPQAKHEFMDDMNGLLALEPDQVDLLTEAESTADEARLTAKHRRPGEQVVVVTSAGHMPRAIRLFAAAGLSPIPAPCDFHYPRAGSPEDKAWKRWIPDGDAVGATRQFLYELFASFAK